MRQGTRYAERIGKVVDFIHEHFGEPLSLEQLSEVAHFSRFHFHRQFTASVGIPVYRLIQLLRLKRAAHRLAFASKPRVTEIAPSTQGDTYGLHYHDATQVLPEDYRMDICVSYPKEVAPNPQGVVSGAIPEGRCARLRHVGSREHIPAADWLYREWLPASGEELRDFPFFFHYVNVGDVKDADMITDLYLPLL